jgi:hypothetical protein
MTKEEMIQEMREKPDAELLLDWMYEQVSDDLKDVIDAYEEGKERS